MAKVHREHGVTLFAICSPLLVVLFGWVPWDTDPRSETVEKRLMRLRDSSWSWDQVEYKRLLETADVNMKIDGKPLFVFAAIETKQEPLLIQMLYRNADVNSSDWGCTPFLAALAADEKKAYTSEPRNFTFARIVLGHHANPNTLPKLPPRQHVPHNHPCFSERTWFDDALDKGDESILAIALDQGDEELVNFLVAHGARASDTEEARRLQAVVLESTKWNTNHDLVALLTRQGGSVEVVFENGDTPLGSAIRKQDLNALRELFTVGADPNKRSRKGELPLEIPLEGCTAVKPEYLKPVSGSGLFDDIEAPLKLRQWRDQDKITQQSNERIADLLERLLEAGADPNLPVTDVSGSRSETILSIAVSRCSSDIPRLLVKHGARIDSAAMKRAVFDLKEFFEHPQVGPH